MFCTDYCGKLAVRNIQRKGLSGNAWVFAQAFLGITSLIWLVNQQIQHRLNRCIEEEADLDVLTPAELLSKVRKRR